MRTTKQSAAQMRPYQRYTRCVMDTTDSKITFDENGICDHCRNFDKNIAPYWKPKENRMDELMQLADTIKKLVNIVNMIVFWDCQEEQTVPMWHI